MNHASSDQIYFIHNTTLYLFLYAFVQVTYYLIWLFFTNKNIIKFLTRLQNKILKKYCQYFKSSEYLDICKNIEELQLKIKKYNKLIERNKKENSHLNSYDLLLLNGKYTRKLLKEEQTLNIYMQQLNDQNKNNYIVLTWNALLQFFSSTDKITSILRRQLCISIIFLSFIFLFNVNFEIPLFKINLNMWFKRNIQIEESDKNPNGLLSFMYGYNIANFFFMTMKENLSNIFIKLPIENKTKKNSIFF
ncbi:conserved Plasmodium protein, unknown function [Plasmodium yoelii]|uniref:Uncharacterized protein n=2 Tax=Plasmodium yoelii TaxID=5861 RepID=A0AAF0B125_PLAYO|nr:conserved Plasmodium protein, unknown function [Plasmodium yoelii]WBY58437.1 hypothetical protein Py17XNL_001105478 [Plasmodium yoelii yoelii]CDU18761.1 conserved Plasmodium protein, unknown function [Plasmodium yoelii]VTZ79346.1 conserved Plasmodium protein, unknown function [Plasmodium yoelii]|eukprot:XP_022812349.1 conserved Plasmodium protein, unknown function [Plasmodium yoelii]